MRSFALQWSCPDARGRRVRPPACSFNQADGKIHCYINRDNPQAGTKIRMVYIAIDAGGAKHENVRGIEFGHGKRIVEDQTGARNAQEQTRKLRNLFAMMFV